MELSTTLTILVASAVLVLAAALGDAHRRKHPHAALALFPWHALLFAGFAGVLFMVVHLLTLLASS